MNWFKKRKLLKRLFNKNFIFFKAKDRWYFEVEVKDEETIKLIKEYIEECKQNT